MASNSPDSPTTTRISLPPELAHFVREQVESGLYSSASEVIREALRLMASVRAGTQSTSHGTDKARVRAAIDRMFEIRDAIDRRGDSLSAAEIRAAINEGRS